MSVTRLKNHIKNKVIKYFVKKFQEEIIFISGTIAKTIQLNLKVKYFQGFKC